MFIMIRADRFSPRSFDNVPLALSRANITRLHIIVIVTAGIPAGLAGSFGHRNPKEMTMFAKSTKVLVAALVLAATSLTFVANASAAPYGQGGSYQGGGSGENYLQDRHNPTNTNGGA